MLSKFKYIIIAGLLILFLSCMFIVEQTQQAIVLEFQAPKRIVTEAGLKFKAPWQSVKYFDKRILNFDTPEEKTFIAGDLKRLEVDAFVKYKISNPLKFLQSVNSERNFQTRLDGILESSVRKVVSEVPLGAMLTEKRVELMGQIKELVNTKAQAFGVDIVDVRITRADFPDQNREDIYARMRSEREREATDLRAKGQEEATIIRAKAERERTVLLADAVKQSEILRGEGDGKASKVYADAYNRDAEFYDFYRSMQAYRGSISKDDTTAILSPDSDFMQYFSDKK
jgi:membrane protease subunit HflC